jgi:hypothetical protein
MNRNDFASGKKGEEVTFPSVSRYVVEDRIAVLYSPGYGAGWTSWATDDQKEIMAFHPKLVRWVLDGKPDGEAGVKAILKELFGDKTPFAGGWEGLTVEWVSPGTCFDIDEYDGYESIKNLSMPPFRA